MVLKKDWLKCYALEQWNSESSLCCVGLSQLVRMDKWRCGHAVVCWGQHSHRTVSVEILLSEMVCVSVSLSVCVFVAGIKQLFFPPPPKKKKRRKRPCVTSMCTNAVTHYIWNHTWNLSSVVDNCVDVCVNRYICWGGGGGRSGTGVWPIVDHIVDVWDNRHTCVWGVLGARLWLVVDQHVDVNVNRWSLC